MAGNHDVNANGQVHDHGFALFTVSIPSRLLINTNASALIYDSLLAAYNSIDGQFQYRSCLLTISASDAGSPVIRAVYRFYTLVCDQGDILALVGYPEEYQDSFTALLGTEPGIRLFNSYNDALNHLVNHCTAAGP